MLYCIKNKADKYYRNSIVKPKSLVTDDIKEATILTRDEANEAIQRADPQSGAIAVEPNLTTSELLYGRIRFYRRDRLRGHSGTQSFGCLDSDL
jgi:hypothetical protein